MMAYENEESIYNLIPPEEMKMPKQKRHKSKFPANLPPTASTFCLKTTSKPNVGNVNGAFEVEGSNHVNKAQTGIFGKALGTSKPKPTEFTKKQTRTMKLSQPTKYQRAGHKKPAVPDRKKDKPIMGLVSDKNFIVANAVENILAAPKVKEDKSKDYTKKKNYGTVPKYLNTIRQEIDQEYDLVRQMQLEEEEQRDREKFLLQEEERKELIDALKKKWEIVHKKYQEITHISTVDTIGLRKKKEGCEKELEQLQKDIEKLSKPYIFVDTTHDYFQY